MLRDALLENLHRQQLNPLEEAAAYEQLLREFGATHEELAARIGRSRSTVTNTLRLLQLSAAVQKRVAAGVLSAGHARALLALDQHDEQERLAARIVAEGLSVRAVEEAVALHEVPAAKPARTRRAAAPGLRDLAETLSDHFETRVKVDLGRSRGRIVIEFASLDDLRRIVGTISPAALAAVQPDGDPAAVEAGPEPGRPADVPEPPVDVTAAAAADAAVAADATDEASHAWPGAADEPTAIGWTPTPEGEQPAADGSPHWG